MRLHTQLDAIDVRNMLEIAKRKGKVTADVVFMPSWTFPPEHTSRTHAHAFEIQLGTIDKDSLPKGTLDQHGKKMRVRKYKNAGDSGASTIWAATWFEWGWFILEVFDADPTARWGSEKHPTYADVDDFHDKTRYAFLEG